MRITAKVDYAVRAAIELARAYPADGTRPVPLTRHAIAEAQDIPSKFLEHILADLKRSQIVGRTGITGNAGELREVLTNLIFNAIDAMPRGGTITIRTRNESGQVVLELSEDREQSGHGAARRRRQIQRLGERHETDAQRGEFLKSDNQVDE